jgi:hypothetical protein
MREKTPKQIAHLKRLGELHGRLWKDPEYRKKMIEKQKALGYRTYR